MKRDKKLIYRILEYVEKHDKITDYIEINETSDPSIFLANSIEDVAYNATLAIDENLLNGITSIQRKEGFTIDLLHLTWKGHDYLERQDS